MVSSIKVLFLSAIILLTASCEEKLDTTSNYTIEQSIKQMMVGIYPENQRLFQQALTTIYQVDQKLHYNLSLEEVTALTNERLQGKTIKEILHMSYASKKIKTDDLPARSQPRTSQLASDSSVNAVIVKTALNSQIK